MNQNEENILRESIRSIIRHVKSKRLNEENQLLNILFFNISEFQMKNILSVNQVYRVSGNFNKTYSIQNDEVKDFVRK